MKQNKRLDLIIFTVVFAILCGLHIFWGIDADPLPNALTKGAPIIMLIIGVLASGHEVPLVVLALLFSLCGDVIAEMPLPGNTAFLMQIAFFAVAQLCYIFAFSFYHSSVKPAPVSAGGDKAVSVVPVFCGIYALCVLGMVISACVQHSRHRILYISGALLFLISDAIIGYTAFFGPLPASGILVMLTYYLAQYLLNISLLVDSRHRVISDPELSAQ